MVMRAECEAVRAIILADRIPVIDAHGGDAVLGASLSVGRPVPEFTKGV